MRNPRLANALAILALVFSPAAKALMAEVLVADAAMRGEVEIVRSLLRDGADVNAAQGDGMTALHWAALNGDVELIRVLLYAGAVVEPTTRLGGHTPLHVASREGQGKAVAALLEAGSSPGTATSTTGVRAIHLAAQSGDTHAIRALLEHGADVDARDSRADRTPLMFATARGRTAAVETLLAAGANVTLGTRVVDYRERAEADAIERRRRQRVIEAAREPQPDEGQERRGRETRQAGAPATPDDRSAVPGAAPSTPAAAPDELDDTPTKPEAQAPHEPDTPTKVPEGGQGGQPEASAPSDPAAREPEPGALSYNDLVGTQGGMTALHYAARDGRADIVHLLLEAGTDVDEVTAGDGSTPLLIAIINGNFDLAMTLLEVGADPNLVSEDEAAPLFATLNNEWALRTWYPQPTASKRQKTSYLDLMDALLHAGADPNARVKTHIWYAAYNAGRMGVDFSGATAFWRAAYATDVAAMRLLVSYGADPNIQTKKPPQRRSRFDGAGPPGARQLETPEEEEDPSGLPEVPVGGPAVHPLHAVSGVGYGTSRVGQQHRYVPNGWIPAVRYLIEELGVDVNIRDHDGYSALHNAAARGDNDLIEYLVGRGADIMVVSRRGQTTVDMANSPHQRVQPYPETIALLEGLGAVNNHKCSACD